MLDTNGRSLNVGKIDCGISTVLISMCILIGMNYLLGINVSVRELSSVHIKAMKDD